MIIETLIKANTPTINGRVYSKDLLKEICQMKTPQYGQLYSIYPITDISKISHEINNLFVNENGLLCVDITPFSTPMGKILSSLNQDHIFANICFNVDNISDDGKDFTIKSIESINIDLKENNKYGKD